MFVVIFVDDFAGYSIVRWVNIDALYLPTVAFL